MTITRATYKPTIFYVWDADLLREGDNHIVVTCISNHTQRTQYPYCYYCESSDCQHTSAVKTHDRIYPYNPAYNLS